MTTPTGPRTPQSYHARVAFDPGAAAAIVATALATFLGVGALAGSLLGPGAILLASQLALLVGVIVAALGWRALAGEPRPWRALLGLRVPRARSLVAAALIGASAWYLNLWLVKLVGVAPSSTLTRAVERDPLALALVTLAVLPPLAEELVFRGVLARALATRLPAAAAIAIAATVFALYHLSLVQLAPTLSLGLLLGALALRSDSALPSTLAHALNNAIAVVIARGEVPALADAIEAHPIAATATCGLATLAGVALLATTPREVA